jgi:hypothetical protein
MMVQLDFATPSLLVHGVFTRAADWMHDPRCLQLDLQERSGAGTVARFTVILRRVRLKMARLANTGRFASPKRLACKRIGSGHGSSTFIGIMEGSSQRHCRNGVEQSKA